MLRKYWVPIGVVAVAVVCAITTVAAQQSLTPDLGGSVAALTGEVRMLRLSVEKSGQTQSQVQAMAVYLSAQQNRLNQSSARADAVRRELEGVNRQMTEISRQLPELERMLSSGALNAKPQDRMNTQEMVDGLRAEMRRLPGLQARLGAQLAEADAAVQSDLARWTEMIARLEQLTR